MKLQVVHGDAVAPQPWRNGGGLTRELLAWPQAADWKLRISVADIRADGPFSAFAGIERWFAVIEGAGVALALPGGTRQVHQGDPPLRFDGEAAPGCTLLDGATRDLNLMIRCDAGSGGMQRAAPGEPFDPTARFVALFTADALTLQAQDGATALPALSLAWSGDDRRRTWRIAAAAPVRAWWLHFEPHA